MLNYFLLSWMLELMYSWMSDFSQSGQYIAAIISLAFLIILVFIVEKHEKQYKNRNDK